MIFEFYVALSVCLFQIKDDLIKQQVHEFVRPSIDFMLTLRFPSGNCPLSIGSPTDKLIHWCHGAPGWIHMFIQAHKVSMLASAQDFGTLTYKAPPIICSRRQFKILPLFQK